jgi:hypothetical protein
LDQSIKGRRKVRLSLGCGHGCDRSARRGHGAIVALWQACGLTRPWNDPAADAGAVHAHQHGVADADGAALVGTVMAGFDGHRGWIYYLAPCQPGKASRRGCWMRHRIGFARAAAPRWS